MKPVLSISLLCCGRKKEEIRKCLDSLKELMNRLPCELIIVDTGCDEEARALIEKYTDHIVPFTWCDDFAKARNAGLREAKGEWFLFIDDDEYFVEMQGLVDFFQSGEYKDYWLACYTIRSYGNLQGTRYTDAWASRLIRLCPETKFVDRIHEYLVPVKGENKLLDNVRVDHYGYAFTTEEEKEKHKERNLKLLEDAIAEAPGNLRIRAHLANEYRAAADTEKLRAICEEGLRLIKKAVGDYSSWKQCFYQGILMSLMAEKKIDEALTYFRKVIKDKGNDDLGRAHMYSMAAGMYYEQGDYANSLRCAEEYIRVYDQEDGKIRKLPICPVFTQTVFSIGTRNNVYCIYMMDRLKEGNTEALKEYFWKLGWGDPTLTIYEQFLPVLMESWSTLPYEEEFVPIAQKLIEDDSVRKLTVNEVKKRIKEDGDEALYPLARIFCQVDAPHYYVWYLKLLYAAKEGLSREVEEACHQLFVKIENVLELEDRIFEIAAEQGISLQKLIDEIPFDQWRSGVDAFCERGKKEKLNSRREALARDCQPGNIRYDYFLVKLAEVEAVYTKGDIGSDAIRDVMRVFADRTVAFYQRFFLPEVFTGEMAMLPAACRLAVRMQRVLQAEQEGNIARFREEITDAMGVFGPMNDALQNFARQYASKRQAQLEEEDHSALDEMWILARQVKQQCRKFIDAGEKETARGILQQLKSLVPEDPDLAELEILCAE